MARYICFEGTEGVGKTTHTQRLANYLTEKGYKVLQTKEPGTPLSPITMKLREIMLSNEFDEDLTPAARELISQAIRSIHLEKIVNPAHSEYDYIVQDRGVLSGLSYGSACGNSVDTLVSLSKYAAGCSTEPELWNMYHDIVYLRGDISNGLDRAINAKQEFKDGDAMESRGDDFIVRASKNMDQYSEYFPNVKVVHMEGKTPDETFAEILLKLQLKDI